MLPVRRHRSGGEHTGGNPTDRGKLGCKHHVLVDQRGLPLVARISGAQVHDSRLLIPLVEAIPAVKGLSARARKRPGKLHAGRAYASRAHRAWLRRRGIAARSHVRAWSHAKGLADGDGSSSEPLDGFTDFADCTSAMSDEQTFTRRSSRSSTPSSAGGTSKGFVRRSKPQLAFSPGQSGATRGQAAREQIPKPPSPGRQSNGRATKSSAPLPLPGSTGQIR
jgi:hypothetical protein